MFIILVKNEIGLVVRKVQCDNGRDLSLCEINQRSGKITGMQMSRDLVAHHVLSFAI